MTDRDLLSQALDALEKCLYPQHWQIDAITALREALAAPMPEPVAWAMLRADGLVLDVICPDERESYQGAYTVPLYAAPPAAPMPEPSDMVMVPREPTPEMIEAGESVEDLYRRGTPHTWKAVYRAMIAAAPPAAPEECDMADDGGCPVCGEDGGTSCGMPNCGLLQGASPATSADYAMGYAEGFEDACQVSAHVKAARESAAPAVPEGDVVVSWNEDGQIVAVTRQESEGRILSVIAESAAPVVREPIIDEMDAVASRYAHKLALDLECVLSDYNGKWWDTAMQTIGEYRMAMNRIHERESPTHMGDPVLPKIGITGESNEI